MDVKVSIYKGYDDSYVIMNCNKEDWERKYGRGDLKVPADKLFDYMCDMTYFGNTELGEEVVFEVE